MDGSDDDRFPHRPPIVAVAPSGLGGHPEPQRPVVLEHPVTDPRWVPLIPGAQGTATSRSGAFLIPAHEDPPTVSPLTRALETDLDLRSALLTCLEALTPQLEPGWSHCQEHASCRAVQEATGVLWRKATEAASPANGSTAEGSAPTDGSPDSIRGPGANGPVINSEAPPGEGP
jgi:hypothetical protein